ncbi:MAG: ribonuclease J [Lachnospiraceae bacterium]|nr:ribonuclease J [Lachnospiraceae bacterium]
MSREQKNNARLKIIPLGGLEQIGMNITAFEYEDSIIVVDCGLAFPEDDMFGIDMVIPDVTYLENNLSKVRGFVITHGHEDHIGALPYVIQKINVPIYATRLTMGIIESKFEEKGLLSSTKRHVVNFGDTVTLGKFKVEFIKTNHSIVDAAALAIYSPVGTVIHTGDFKVDYTPVFGDAIDLQRFAEIGKAGVLALMCDSTNAERPGYTQSEKTVGVTIDRIFQEHQSTRIIIATFASNVDRVQQIINSAYKYGRKVVIEGRSMVQIIDIAQKLGCIKIPENTLMGIDELRSYPDNKTVIITTGSQGESMAALSRMAEDTHKKVKIKPGDTIIFSSHPIPGNEKSVTNVINKLLRKGADVIFQDVHVSGHPCQEELKLIYSLVQPKYAIPVHGEYRHLIAQSKIAAQLGVPKDNIFILQSGDVLELDKKSAKVTGKVPTGGVLVDGLGVGDVGNVVMRDRQHLAEDGIVVVAFAIDADHNLVSGPDITSRGFVYVKEADVMMNEATAVAEKAIFDCLDADVTDENKIRSMVRDGLSDFFWKKTKRSPMILPVILNT